MSIRLESGGVHVLCLFAHMRVQRGGMMGRGCGSMCWYFLGDLAGVGRIWGRA